MFSPCANTFYYYLCIVHIICWSYAKYVVIWLCHNSYSHCIAANRFLGGLSLHLNHLIESRMTNYNWPFGTLPFGLFASNLDTNDLETYPRTYSGHFWNMSIFDDSRAIWVLFRKWVVSENQSFLNEAAIVTPLIGLVLGGEVPRLNYGPICFPIRNTSGGAMGRRKSSTTFLTLSQRIKAHLLLMYCIKNLSIGVS